MDMTFAEKRKAVMRFRKLGVLILAGSGVLTGAFIGFIITRIFEP